MMRIMTVMVTLEGTMCDLKTALNRRQETPR